MNVTLEEFNALMGSDSHLRDAFARARAGILGSYADFVERLYRDIDKAIFGLQRSRELLQADIEDRITLDILLPLRQLGYTAEHDAKVGGHVDLSVAYGEYTWIGEAKREGHFREGFLQLMTRYTPLSGNYRDNAGGLLFYFVTTKDARGKLDEWMQELSAEALSCTNCDRNPLAFFSEHKLEGPGTKFHVRSMAVTLYHQPQDASGRATRARRAAKANKIANGKSDPGASKKENPSPNKRGVKQSTGKGKKTGGS